MNYVSLFAAILTAAIVYAAMKYLGWQWVAVIILPLVAFECWWRWRYGYWRPDRW